MSSFSRQRTALASRSGPGRSTHDGLHVHEDERGLKLIFDIDKDKEVCHYCGGEPHGLPLEIFPLHWQTALGAHVEDIGELYRLRDCGAKRWEARWKYATLARYTYRDGYYICYDGWVVPKTEYFEWSETFVTRQLSDSLTKHKGAVTIAHIDWYDSLKSPEIREPTPKRPRDLEVHIEPCPHCEPDDRDIEGYLEERAVRRCLSFEEENNKWEL